MLLDRRIQKIKNEKKNVETTQHQIPLQQSSDLLFLFFLNVPEVRRIGGIYGNYSTDLQPAAAAASAVVAWLAHFEWRPVSSIGRA